jgi:uncharacterized membrane protein YoaK (UPF0700 family)
MILTAFTFVHVAISLIAIATGLIVMAGFLAEKQLNGWTAWFLWTTVLTSVTGYFFPYHGFKPSYVVGAISLVFLALALFALYKRQLAGGWRKTYVISAMIALYLNVFVLIAQLFMKVPALKALAPTQSEPPFKLTQLTILILFFLLTTFSAIRFRDAAVRTA